MTENIVTKSEFAKILNRKPSYIDELAKYGRIVFDETGKKILVAESKKLIEESADLSKTGVIERHEQARVEKTQPTKTDNSEPIGTNGDIPPYPVSKASKEFYLSEKARLEHEQSIGLLLVAEDVVKTVVKAVSIIRTRFEALPDILSEQLAAESDPQKIKSMLRDYIESFLTELSQLFKLGAV